MPVRDKGDFLTATELEPLTGSELDALDAWWRAANYLSEGQIYLPENVAPETPGSIHEGGELGYSLAHAYGAAFDNPDLIVARVIGDDAPDVRDWKWPY